MKDNLVIIFFKWYFVTAPARILRLGLDFLRWGWRFFSIGYFAPRIFSPWHRDVTGYGRGFDLKRILHVLGWNLISRLIGAVLRLFVMLAGLLVEAVIVSFTAAAFVWWLTLPILSVVFVALGVVNISV